MIQRLRVPIGFLIAVIVLYLATPKVITIGIGLPFAIAGAIVRGMAAGYNIALHALWRSYKDSK